MIPENPVPDPQKDRLADAVAQSHSGPARLLTVEAVTERHAGKVAWDGEVHVFAIEGHPQADRLYAWAYDTDKGTRAYITVLGIPPINSAKDAVRAAIASGQQE